MHEPENPPKQGERRVALGILPFKLGAFFALSWGTLMFLAMTPFATASAAQIALSAVIWLSAGLVGGAIFGPVLMYVMRALALGGGASEKALATTNHSWQMSVSGERDAVLETIEQALKNRGTVTVVERDRAVGVLVVKLKTAALEYADLITVVTSQQGPQVGVRLTSRPSSALNLFDLGRNHGTVHAIADALVDQFDVDVPLEVDDERPLSQVRAKRVLKE